MTSRPILRIAVPLPLYRLLDYLAPQGESGVSLQPGCRVEVTVANRKRVGIIWEIAQQSELEPGKLRPVGRVLDRRPLFDDRDRKLLGWCAAYYHHPLGEVVQNALPARLRQGLEAATGRVAAWRLVDRQIDLERFRRAPLQKQIVSRLLESDGPVPEASLRAGDSAIRGALKRLADKGVVERVEILPEPVRSPPSARPTLTGEQQAAVEAVLGVTGYGTFLLDGITGSGKTEVYLAIAGQVIRAGRQVLVLVPEIALTPQLLSRFEHGLAARIAVMHSGLNDSEREQAWTAAADGRIDLLIGTRSAIFTPMPQLGMIVVDEEHDLSYKQQEGYRYSARDIAVMRARLASIPAILGSATPSLESFNNALSNRYRWLKLRHRPGPAKPPRIDLIDVRNQPLRRGLAPDLISSIRRETDAGHQAILFLNRRGYSPQLTCHACGWVAECSHCDARMTWHQQAARLWCHHCGHQQPRPATCPGCGAADSLIHLGQGTERLEETIGEIFPHVPVIRIDRDSTRRKGSLDRSLARVRDSDAAILVGTQMLAKGHDLPKVTLVGILNADHGLLNPDFRAPERTAQLLIQVSGRAGRADKPGRVLIQTRHPDNPLLQRLIREGYEAFAREELALRREAGFPPFSHQVLLRAESMEMSRVEQFMQQASERARREMPGIEIHGPLPALLERKAGHYRWHLLFQSHDRSGLHREMDRLLAWLLAQKAGRKLRWSLDSDPQEIL
ncbi:MAG: primosomal protein N' [Gammaproteobacteria bacterium]|jgi:primosomal protein N' (replication factor Y) (superfamily II helicase)